MSSAAIRLSALAVAMIVAGCAVDPASHCEARQKFWEHANGEDRADAERMASLFIPSCTKLLSKPEAHDELVCRDKCLADARKDTPPLSREAKDAYVAFSGCEAGCLGAKPGPQPVSP
ncbi:MAG: hypothetical protein HOV80_28375 [Polyangiaceae bacterium]|nr:hypothetical protein [Polyangiaceae bacterium]